MIARVSVVCGEGVQILCEIGVFGLRSLLRHYLGAGHRRCRHGSGLGNNTMNKRARARMVFQLFLGGREDFAQGLQGALDENC